MKPKGTSRIRSPAGAPTVVCSPWTDAAPAPLQHPPQQQQWTGVCKDLRLMRVDREEVQVVYRLVEDVLLQEPTAWVPACPVGFPGHTASQRPPMHTFMFSQMSGEIGSSRVFACLNHSCFKISDALGLCSGSFISILLIRSMAPAVR